MSSIPVIEDAMEKLLILQADHEQNASTSTVRLAGSSGANPFACISAGIACLWGPAHGGANEAALNMLREIGTPTRIPEFIARAKNKDDPFRLMGFGHRVYKNYDPRAKVMAKVGQERPRQAGHRRSDLRRRAASSSTSRSTTPISSTRSCIPTSISIRASSCRRSASRPRCSPCCSPSRAPSAGSRSGPR